MALVQQPQEPPVREPLVGPDGRISERWQKWIMLELLRVVKALNEAA